MKKLFLYGILVLFYNLCFADVLALNSDDALYKEKLFAIEDTYDEYDNNFAESVYSGESIHIIQDYQYFTKLGLCYGDNLYGTCTIVSSQIMFNYYDTFYNDNLVREIYDFTQNINGDSYATATEFENTTSGLQTAEDFHQFLIGFASGLDLDIIDEGAYAGDQLALIENYLVDIGINYTVEDATIVNENTSNYDILNEAKKRIDSGRPIVVNSSGHSTVAFAYDDDYLYIHSGWKSKGVCRRPLEYYYDGNIDFIDIIPNSTMLLSNNYYLTEHYMYVSPREEILDTNKKIYFDNSGSYTIKSSSINDYIIEFYATGTVYVSVCTDVDRDIDFSSINCPYEYDYYSDIGGINDEEYDHDAMITVWEIPAGGTFNFSILDVNFDITINITTI